MPPRNVLLRNAPLASSGAAIHARADGGGPKSAATMMLRSLIRLAPTLLAAVSLAASPLAAAERSRAPRRAVAQVSGVGSLDQAFARAFAGNPDIQAQRAQVRATRETITQARSAMLPQVSASAYAGVLATRSVLRGTGTNVVDGATLGQRGVALTATQNLFDGWRTQNSVHQAQVLTVSQRLQLDAIEQAVMLDVATTYIAVLTGQALVEAQRTNVGFLSQTLGTTRTRLASGVATPTDVSQAEARLSRGQADLVAAEADLLISRDRFLRLVGAPPASRLTPVRNLERLMPASREASREQAGRSNPAVLAAAERVKAAEAGIRIAQGQLLPQVTLQGQAARDLDLDSGTRRTDSLSLSGRVTVPLYSGGGLESQVRQAQELAGLSRFQLDAARLQARSAAYAGHTAYDSAGATVRAGLAEVRAAEVTVDGMRRQLEAGTRTVTELLNAQQDLIAARSRLIQAQGDRLLATYTVTAALGRLQLPRIGVRAPTPPVVAPRSDLDVRFDAWRDLRPPPVTPARR